MGGGDGRGGGRRGKRVEGFGGVRMRGFEVGASGGNEVVQTERDKSRG